MIGLLIITHQTLGAAYAQLVQHFFPNQKLKHIKIHSVEASDDHTDIIQQVQTLLPQLNTGNGVLILTDIFGATPCNAALKLIVPQQSSMVTGLNAPMLIKAISHSTQHNDLQTFTQLVRDAGMNGIMMFPKSA